MPKPTAQRSLTVEKVTELVKSIDTPIAQIERDLGIPATILSRAMKPGTDKPLPVKFELPLLNYVKEKKMAEIKEKPQEEEVEVEDGEQVAEVSAMDMIEKMKWVKDIREARKIAHAHKIAKRLTE